MLFFNFFVRSFLGEKARVLHVLLFLKRSLLASSIRGHVGAQKARVNGVYGVNDEIVITSKLVKSIWFFCSVSNFALSKVNFIELVSKT